MQYLNKTFMGAQRIYVEFAERYGGSRLPRAWSKYTQGTSRYNKLHAKEEGAAEQKLGVRELKKLRRKEREGQHPEEGATHYRSDTEMLSSSACMTFKCDHVLSTDQVTLQQKKGAQGADLQ